MRSEREIVLVTGSTGRIGDAVMRRFSSRKEDVVGFDRKAPDPSPPGCTFIPVDVTSDESVQKGLPENATACGNGSYADFASEASRMMNGHHWMRDAVGWLFVIVIIVLLVIISMNMRNRR